MGLRRRSREAALKILYQTEMSGYDTEECIRTYWENLKSNDETREFSSYLVRGVITHKETIDKKIQGISKHWSIERIHKVDLNILRVAVFEMYYAEDIPFKATINEAIEMAKKFGTDDSPSFINGILGKISEEIKDKKQQVPK